MSYKVLHLDKSFNPYFGEEIDFELIKFSGGELHIKINSKVSNKDTVIITNRFNSSDDIIKVLIAKNALEIMGVKAFELVMPYIPYARQDRVCNVGESFTLKVFANIINSAKFDKIYVIDSHSDVAPALLNNSINISNLEYVEKTYNKLKELGHNDIVLISPDSGANKKINKLFYDLPIFNSLVKCDKVRDTKTGKLNGFEVFANDLNGKTCLIIDDICDGGRTFIGIAKELKKKNAGKIYLFVTHGIFSKGFNELSKYFDGIFTTNSIKDIENNLLTQFKIDLL